ncbi:MAG: hypothetical protein JO361_05595 [Gammaproteobacteria bacterium]|nr:hypothetical protein [Gammaproteobacteria bacterium]
MKAASVITVAATTLVVAALAGCGGAGGSAPASITGAAPQSLPPPQSLDTAQVLAQARATSETSEPYRVNDGALTLTGTTETAEPIAVGGG